MRYQPSESVADRVIIPNVSRLLILHVLLHCVFVVPYIETGTNYSPVPAVLESVIQFP